MEPLYDGRVGLFVSDAVRGTWALPKHEMVGVGRLPGLGIHVPDSWVPSRLCRFIPYEMGWLVQLGRAQAEVKNKHLGKIAFPRRSIVALQAGRTLISFPELDDNVRLPVIIGAGEADGHPVAEDRSETDRVAQWTSYGAARAQLTDHQRTVAAVAFEHLIKRTSAPENIAAAAAAKLGSNEGAVKKVLTEVRRKVNDERWLNLRTTEHLGTYLVLLSRNLTWSDLPAQFQGA